MYDANISTIVRPNKLLEVAFKLYGFFKQAINPAAKETDGDRFSKSFVTDIIERGETVVDIGAHGKEYFFTLIEMSKRKGTLVAFETQMSVYNYLLKKVQLLHLTNIAIEHLGGVSDSDTNCNCTSTNINRSTEKQSALVIDINERIQRDARQAKLVTTIDQYCTINAIKPALVRIKAANNDLQILEGATQTIKKYKPKIVIECGTRIVSAEKLTGIFKYLADSKYAGYFLLDTMKISLSSFDFNIYHNEVLGFYCNTFIFE